MPSDKRRSGNLKIKETYDENGDNDNNDYNNNNNNDNNNNNNNDDHNVTKC